MFKFARLVSGLHVVSYLVVRATRPQHSIDEDFIINHQENRHEVLIDKLLQLLNARHVMHNRHADFVLLIGVKHFGFAQAVGVSLIAVVDDELFPIIGVAFDGLINLALVGVAVIKDASRDGRDIVNAHRQQLRNHRGLARGMRS